MKLKDNAFIIVILGGLLLVVLGNDNSWIEVAGISITYLAFIVLFFYETVKWYKNAKLIGTNYSKINMVNIVYEMWLLFTVNINLTNSFKTRASELWYFENKSIEINTFSDFLTSYEGTEKLAIYMIIGIGLGAIISIIKKVICRGKITEDYILLSNGDLINIKEIEDLKVEDSSWTFSKKITIKHKGKEHVININKRVFEGLEGILNVNMN